MPRRAVLVDVAERALATFIQAFVGVLTAGAVANIHALKDATNALIVGALAGLYAVAKYAAVVASAYLAANPPPPAAPTPSGK